MTIKVLVLVVAGLAVSAPSVSATESTSAGFPVENHSFARTRDAVMHHLVLDIAVDFEEERISGRASVHINNKTGTTRLFLDTRGLEIERVTLGVDERPTTFSLGEAQGHLGQPLQIDIRKDTKIVNIDYQTTDGATGLDWLAPSQTLGGKYPFLFTQGQAILNRTWIPCQDSPEVRITYEATVTVPKGMLAVMSASNSVEKSDDGVYTFSMPQPIPAYLIALAAGDLAFKAISERCGVFAAPEIVEKAAWEFADTEKMIQQAESMYGPYRWERYDIIVLPPSFPFGGMENPRLSFVTPVLLAGDRSLVSTIAHELAHSWSGNLVTNATWNDFWLNEGFTTYFERRISEALYGTERMEMQARLGLNELETTVARLGENSPDTRLYVEVAGRDPDEGLSMVAYEKGYFFLRLLEETVGREKWDAFLRGYFDRFAFQSMTTATFVQYLRDNLVPAGSELESQIQINAWVYEPGIPDNLPAIQSEALKAVETAVADFAKGKPVAALGMKTWSSQQLKRFLQQLPDPIPIKRMEELDGAFDLTHKSNGEVRQVWFLHAIENGYEPAVDPIEEYLVGIGRIWLIRPLYTKLASTEEGKKRANEIYRKARPGYHPLTASIVDRIVGWEETSSN